MGTWTHLMVHCTATPSLFDVRREHIEKWHLHERGWSRVGYSMLVERSGELDIMIGFDRDEVIESWEISNGARGWNGSTKHIAYAGGLGKDGSPEDNRTDEQKASLITAVKMLVMLYPSIKVIGHNQVSDKFCPSFDVRKWAKSIGIPDKNIDFHKYADNPFLT